MRGETGLLDIVLAWGLRLTKALSSSTKTVLRMEKNKHCKDLYLQLNVLPVSDTYHFYPQPTIDRWLKLVTWSSQLQGLVGGRDIRMKM